MLNFIKHFPFDSQTQRSYFFNFQTRKWHPTRFHYFLMAINNVGEVIKFPINYTLFADYLTILCHGKNTNIQLILQDTISSLIKWSAISEYRFSAQLSQSIIFSRFRKYQTLRIKINIFSIATSKTIMV